MTDDGMPTRTGRVVRGQTAAERRVLIAGLIAVGLLGAVYLVALWTRAGQRFEDSVLAGAELGVGKPGEQRATHLLNVITVYSLGVAMVAVLVIGWLRRRRTRAYAGVGVIVASVITVEILKWLVHRPVLLDSGQRREDQSFPSGHVAVAMSVMCAFVMITPSRFRGLVALVTSAWGTAIGVAAVTASMHRPSDIVGSHLIVVLYTCVAITVLARAGPRNLGHRHAPLRGTRRARWRRRRRHCHRAVLLGRTGRRRCRDRERRERSSRTWPGPAKPSAARRPSRLAGASRWPAVSP